MVSLATPEGRALYQTTMQAFRDRRAALPSHERLIQIAERLAAAAAPAEAAAWKALAIVLELHRPRPQSLGGEVYCHICNQCSRPFESAYAPCELYVMLATPLKSKEQA